MTHAHWVPHFGTLTWKIVNPGHCAILIAFCHVFIALITVDCLLSIHILSDCATESDLKDLKNELEIMDSVGHHPNLVNLIGACSSEGELALKLELNILGLADDK